MSSIKFCIAAIFLLFAAPSLGQVDPSTAILLRSSGSSSGEQDFTSSRYSTRPLDQSRTRQSQPVQQNTRQLQTNKLPAKKAEAPKPAPKPVVKKPEPVVEVKEPVAATAQPIAVQPEAQKVETIPDKIPERVLKILKKPLQWSEEVITGESSEDKVVEAPVHHFAKLHPNDRRRNLVEIDFAPNYLYVEASSPSWYRDYFISSPGFTFAANLMFSPQLIFRTQYIGSLGADMKANTTGSEFLSVEYQRFETGIRFRHFSGLKRQSKWFVYGIDFSESVLDVPTDSYLRAGNESQGIRLSAEAYLPSSKYRATNVGFELLPSLDHKERFSNLNLVSGSSPQTNAFGLWVGQRIILNRRHQLYWKVSHRIEKTQYSGTTNVVDPISGLTLRGVPIETGMTVFSLGLTWGQ